MMFYGCAFFLLMGSGLGSACRHQGQGSFFAEIRWRGGGHGANSKFFMQKIA